MIWDVQCVAIRCDTCLFNGPAEKYGIALRLVVRIEIGGYNKKGVLQMGGNTVHFPGGP